MTADDRLNQLEPVLSETVAILDRHTAQLQQLKAGVGQLGTAMIQQGENISFLLHEQVAIKTDVATLKTDVGTLKTDVGTLKTDVGTLKTDVATLKTDVGTLKTDMAQVKTDVGTLKTGMAGVNGKLDQVLQLLQKPGK